jgi:hypothetical protein
MLDGLRGICCCFAGSDIQGDVVVLPSQHIFPVDWRNQRGDSYMPNKDAMDWTICDIRNATAFDPKRRKSAFPKSYSISWWAHSWRRRSLQ